ncbi:MAG: Holliday junction resolvase-like protein [Candidatus Midichloriaceae bacterium]|jgi:putative Holliday junction resolvase|nr:Holliday junction resolvase-like protein [Candidatus Midichloriaceae bacterium]
MQEGLCEKISDFLNAVQASGKDTIFALDLGGRKVGVAKSNLSLKIPVPFIIIEYKNQTDLSQKLKTLIKENLVGGLVIGLPKEDLKSKFAKFISEMQLEMPFIFEDESYTTKMANEMLSRAGMKRKKRNEVDDKISAQIILNSFLQKT